MARAIPYLVGIVLITPLWFISSCWLAIMMAGYEDAQVLPPLWLQFCWDFVVPVHFILSLTSPIALIYAAVSLNSFLGAFLVVFTLRNVKKLAL